ncbi:hypothetical protein [Mucilaginibacter sp.]|uniref:hypothetical protein n=1 Tax=Mucilaginibacter sp. TaxID=1882438 RepID=UPI003267AD8B
MMLSEIKSIGVYLLYSPSYNEEYTFFEIVKGMPLDLKDYEVSNFWGVDGGIEIVVNGYCSIHKNTDFHYLVEATNFLIRSLYWLQGKKSDRFDVDDDYPNDVVVRTTGNKLLLLKDINEREISLSFTSLENNDVNARGVRYFENILIAKSDWSAAVKLALSEYFEVLLKVVQNNPNDSTSKTMMNYYNDWRVVA